MADITWRTTRLPDAIVGVPYEASLAYTGAATAVTAIATSGGTGLPASNNLAFDASKTRITGTPKTVDLGVYTFKVSVTDTAGAAVMGSNVTLVVRHAKDEDGPSLDANGSVKSQAEFARLWPLSS